MKIPKSQKRYCPVCKTHTEHKVIQNKRKQASSLKRGSKYRAKERGLAKGFGNSGRYSKPAVTKTDLRYQCMECHKTHIISSGQRSKRVELV